MSESRVKYHKFTGAIPIVFTESISDFISGLDESLVSDASPELQSAYFREVDLPGTKFLVFSESMLRTLFGPLKKNLAVECVLAIWKGSNRYPLDAKAAAQESLRLAKKHNRSKVFEILKSKFETKFGEITAIESEEKHKETPVEERVFSITEAGDSFERQETGVVSAINKASNGKPITVSAGGVSIAGVIGAEKFKGRAASGSEPYTDVVLKTASKDINLSNKGSSAPSLAGGGRSGIETVLPGFLEKILVKANRSLKSKYKKGESIPDVYSKIEPADALKLVRGTKDIGGPIDYFYIGSMDVKSEWDQKTRVLTLNGSFITPQAFVKSHPLYIRLRKRREDQPYDPDIKDKFGYPGIMGKSPSKGDTLARVVVTDKISGKGIILK